MTRYNILEAALEERYEYLEELKAKKETIEKLIKELENEVDEMLINILENTPKQEPS
ncbi:MAG: hypothetical protein N3B21_15755 [Clostridia bacterium]|nr:hypothetical protein [Clostridia bacterium]